MKTKLVLMVAVLMGVLSLISGGYCFWLMNVPLSYRLVPVVLTGFLLAIFMFIISLITSVVAFIRLRRSPRAPNVPQIRPTI
jgi:membrane protein implicated in regulation of membrane protease activity